MFARGEVELLYQASLRRGGKEMVDLRRTSRAKNRLAWNEDPDDFLQLMQWQSTLVIERPKRL